LVASKELIHFHLRQMYSTENIYFNNRERKLMAWIYLTIAGIFEWGWPVGLKLGWGEEGAHLGWILFAAVCMAASGALLLIAQKSIPIRTPDLTD